MPRKATAATTKGFKKISKAIAKDLVGKPVPSKYRKEYGKRYGTVTSVKAANKITGFIRKEQLKKKKKMPKKK